MNWQEFFAMGGYAVYVWGSYGFTLVVLVLNVVMAIQKKRAALKMLSKFISSEITERI